MAKLEGDRQPLRQDGAPRFGLKIWIAFAIILIAIALAVWRHSG